ncbi:MAG: hypothetical protein ACYDC6_13640 [Acidobacteriaceae bacterium]
MLTEIGSISRKGVVSPESASARLAHLPFEDIGFAKLDRHRPLRAGLPEVILASGKPPEQVAEIFERMAESGGNVLATRADPLAFTAVRQRLAAAQYFPACRIMRSISIMASAQLTSLP